MTITSLSPLVNTTDTTEVGRGFEDMGQDEFFRLLTVQMQQQDPFDPVDNNQMLAQMAQFTSLSGITDVNTTLQEISAKFDSLESRLDEAVAQNSEDTSTTETET